MARTPISATGNSGFTLVELMIALVVVGLAAAAVTLALPDRQAEAAREAEMLAARLAAARDLAIVAGHDMAARIDATGYRFEQRGLDGWHAATAKPLQPRTWPPGLVVSAEADGGRIRFAATGSATPASVRLMQNGATATISVAFAGKVRVDAQ